MRRSTWWSGWAAGALVLGAGSVGIATAAEVPQQGASHAEKDYAGRLLAVDAYSTSEAWAVGYAGDTLLTVHWDGATWTKIAAPQPEGATSASFDGVAIIAPDDVWAVGEAWSESPSEAGAAARLSSLIEHWDGAAWTIVSGADLGGRSFPSLTDVSGSGPNDVWAVGTYYPGAGIRRPLVEHWDGVAWTQVDQPRPPRYGPGALSSVSAVSETEAWFAGDAIRLDGTDDTLIARWDGVRWSRTHSPGRRGYFTGLQGISAASNAAFAVGQSYYAKPLLTHWDGSTWVRDALPERHAKDSDLWGVSATSARDVWVAGSGSSNGSWERPLTWHWDGSMWSSVPCPGVEDSKANHLWAVSATDEDDAWAVGDYAKDGAVRVLIERWDGTTWQRWTM